jgi:protoporphyrinogen oxidase
MKVQTLIAGGGLAGLACARELADGSRPYLLVEKQKETGGLCRSVLDRGFSFDYTGHFLHFHKPELRQWASRYIGKIFKERRRHAVIYSQGGYSEYPYQENNAELPSAILRENVLGYLEAALRQRFGKRPDSSDQNFERWCLEAFGRGISRHFMFPYNRKLWKFPLNQLTTHWMGRFVPSPKIREVVAGALTAKTSDSGYNATFLYPDRGGISLLPQGIARGLSSIWRGAAVQRIDLKRRKACLDSGFEVDFEFLVSSLPLPQLANLTEGLPARLQSHAKKLKATSIYNINFGLKGKQPIPYSWVYFPENSFQFHRAGSVSACVPTVAPSGYFSLYVEFSYRGTKPNPVQLGRHAVQKLKQLGWIQNEKQIVSRVDLNLPGAYVIYDRHRDEAVQELLSFYEKQNVYSVGRYGRWEYGSMESALEQGIQAAQVISAS